MSLGILLDEIEFVVVVVVVEEDLVMNVKERIEEESGSGK